jgi:hypothetical protein
MTGIYLVSFNIRFIVVTVRILGDQRAQSVW